MTTQIHDDVLRARQDALMSRGRAEAERIFGLLLDDPGADVSAIVEELREYAAAWREDTAEINRRAMEFINA